MDQHEVLVNRLQGKYGTQGVLEAGYLSAPTNGLTASGYFNSDLKIHSLKHLSTFVQETREQLRHSTSSRDSANMRGSFDSRSAEFVKDIRNSSNSAQVAHEELRPSLRGSFGERHLEVSFPCFPNRLLVSIFERALHRKSDSYPASSHHCVLFTQNFVNFPTGGIAIEC